MKAVNKMFLYMVKQITQEMMMIMLAIAPVLAGLFFRIGIPFLEEHILRHYGLEQIIIPYYEIFSWLLSMLTGMLFAFVGGLVVLGEIDDNVAKYIMITPAGIRGYLCSRIIIPAIISAVVAVMSSNKVEGMAIGKISGLFGVMYFVPLLVTGTIRYVFCLFPMFWIGEWSVYGGGEKLIIAFCEFPIWICIMLWQFYKKMV